MQSGTFRVRAKPCRVDTPGQANVALAPFRMLLGASHDEVNDGYLSWIVSLTTLAPEIVAAIPDETLPSDESRIPYQ